MQINPELITVTLICPQCNTSEQIDLLTLINGIDYACFECDATMYIGEFYYEEE